MKYKIVQIAVCIQVVILIFLFVVSAMQYTEVSELKIPLTDWQSKYINFHGGWYIDENIIQTNTTIDLIYGPYIELKKGTYTVNLDYECDEDQSCLVYTNSENDKYIKTQLEKLQKGELNLSYDFTLTKDIDNLEVIIKYNGKGFLKINDIDIVPNTIGMQRKVWITLYFFLLLDASIYLGYVIWKSNSVKIKKNIIQVFCLEMIVAICLIIAVSMQYLNNRNLEISIKDWRSKYIDYRIGGWYIDENIIQTSDTIDMIYGPYIELKKGIYSIRIDYECEEDQGCLVYANSGNDAYIDTNLETLQKDKRSISYDFVLTEDIDNLEAVIKYSGKGGLIIKDISIKENILNLLKKQLIIFAVLFLLNLCILLCVLCWKVILFIIGLCILFGGVFVAEEQLVDSRNFSWVEMKEIHKYPNSYDICFFGPSTAQTNNSNQELYEKYGIAGISLADGLEPIYILRYVLEETLQFQTPIVVFFDTNPLFYSEEINRKWAAERENFLLYDYLDGMQTLPVRIGAFRAIQKYNADIDTKDFIQERWEKGHQNWKNIIKSDSIQPIVSECHGNIELMGVEDSFQYTYATSDSKSAIISEDTERYLSEMIEVCNKKGVEFILLTEDVTATKSEYNTIAVLAERYGVKHISINDYISEMDFSFERDLNDYPHFNLSGAIKVSDWLGEYLSTHYEISDKRTDSAYKRYEERKELFEEKKKILSEPTLREYLKELADLDKKEYTIFISTEGEASAHLEDSDTELLEELGIKTDLTETGYGYAAVIHDSIAQEKIAWGDTVELRGEKEGIEFKIISDGQSEGENGSIVINGIEYIQKGDGFQFVIYNRKDRRVKDAIYFDTANNRNPFGAEISGKGLSQ